MKAKTLREMNDGLLALIVISDAAKNQRLELEARKDVTWSTTDAFAIYFFRTD